MWKLARIPYLPCLSMDTRPSSGIGNRGERAPKAHVKTVSSKNFYINADLSKRFKILIIYFYI